MRWGSGTAEWATEVRMPDSLSDAKMVNKAALDCPDAPLGRHKVGETFPKSAGCTLEEQKRPKVLPKGFGASLKCIEPKKNYYCPLKVSEQRDIHPQCCCNGIADDFSEGKPLS